MGISLCTIFQKQEDGEWKDVFSEYNAHGSFKSYHLYAWIGSVLTEPRGFPKDFDIADETHHPIQDMNILPKDQWVFVHPPRGLFMGGWGYSWLSADEVIAAYPNLDLGLDRRDWRDHEGENDEAKRQHAIDEIKKDEFEWFINELTRLKALYGAVRVVYGLG